MSKEIAKKFENQLSKYYLQTIHDLLEEQEINPQQFMHMAVNQIKRNNKLLEIFKTNPASIFSSILTCAEFGLSPTSQMGEAWLIPYGKECQFQIGYQGLTKILYKNPDVQNITAECVFENDEFDYSLGLTPTLEHKPSTQDRGNLIAVYCVVRFANQQPIFKVMTIQELKTIQNLSKAGNRSVWFSKTDPQYWMLKKTVFKQLCKLLPKHLNMSKVISYDNIVEGGGAMRLDDENKPIVIEEEAHTRADKFKNAMEEDIVKDRLKEIDPTIQVNKVYEAEVVEEKTEKKYTKEEMQEIKEDMPGFEGTKEALDELCDIRKDKTKPLIIEKCPVAGIDAIGISIPSSKSTQIEEGLDHKGGGEDDLSDEDDDTPKPEDFIPEIMEDDTPPAIESPKPQEEKMLEEYTEEINFEEEDKQRREKTQESQNSFLDSEPSKEIDVEL